MNIIVTGGSRGIGRCLVQNLARDGHNVLLNYNKSDKQAKNLQEVLREEGILIEIFKADVSKKNEVKEMVKFALEKWGKIDVLINNAGVSLIKLFTDYTDEDWNSVTTWDSSYDKNVHKSLRVTLKDGFKLKQGEKQWK